MTPGGWDTPAHGGVFMKALIKSGLCLALGWLASGAGAQEVKIKWQAAPSDAPARPVALTQPAPLDTPVRPVSGGFAPIVRLQAPDEITIQPVPVLEGKEPKPAQKLPKDKDGFTPPNPQAMPTPIYSSLMPDGCGPDICAPSGCGPAWCRSLFTCRGCPDGPRFYTSTEGLLWWQKGQATPPLITSNPVGTATAQTGILTTNTTGVLYDHTGDLTQGGARFPIGGWMPTFF